MNKLMIMSVLLMSSWIFNSALPMGRQPASNSARINVKPEVKQSWSFNYKDLSKKPFQIKKEAASYEEAYKAASKDCYQQLTQGKYPGEEKGLDIIDICANPKI